MLGDKGEYEPSKEVLQFNGYEDGKDGAKLLSFTYFTDEQGYPRYFNQKLAKYFYKIMKDVQNTERHWEQDWTFVEGDFFQNRQKKGVVYHSLRKATKG